MNSTGARPSISRARNGARCMSNCGLPGFSKWLGNFRDIMTDRVANEDFAEFVREKIRARVKDLAVAEKLVPKDHLTAARGGQSHLLLVLQEIHFFQGGLPS